MRGSRRIAFVIVGLLATLGLSASAAWGQRGSVAQDLKAGLGTTVTTTGVPDALKMSIGGGYDACQATLHPDPTNGVITATVTSACNTGHFWLITWSTPSDNPASSHPQTIFAYTNQAPWTVALPACFYQADFSYRLPPPGPQGSAYHRVAGLLGQSTCPTTTTSRNTTTTTGAISTTTTIPTTTTTTKQTTTTMGSPTSSSVPISVSSIAEGSTTTTPNSTTSSTTGVPISVLNSPGGPPTAQPSSAAPGGGALAFTGFDMLGIASLAVLLGMAGYGIYYSSRRRPEINGVYVDTPPGK